MSSSLSSSRTVQYQAYSSTGINGRHHHDLVSGMSSAGQVCTTQLRDAREREKREIGLLNDRLADYIEKVRFLKAQNHVLSHDIELLRRGFSSGGSISSFFESEITQSKRTIEQILATRSKYQTDITHLTAEIDTYRKKWLDALSVVKCHREDHDVNLDRLAEIEAQVALFNRKIRIVDEDVIRIRRENGLIQSDLGRIRSQIHSEIALKNERSLSVQSLLQRVKVMQTENVSRIEQELIFIRRDTTIEYRDYFRAELQAAMRDIRANYEAVSIRNREELEIWYHKKMEEIRRNSGFVYVDHYRDELISIRHTLSSVQSRFAEIESRNTLLASTIADLKRQQSEEARIFEMLLAEKDERNVRLRERCTEISIQMEKLCDHETSLHAELERYRTLLNGANVTTYLSTGSSAHRSGHLATTTTTTSSTTHQTSGYTAGYSSTGSRGITIGGNIGGISVGGHIDGAHVSGGVGVNGGYHQSSYSYSSSSQH